MLGSLRLHLVLVLVASAAACGIELQINPDGSSDGGVTPDPGTSSSGGTSSSSGDGTSSSSSGEPGSSSSSSSGTVADAGPDADAPDLCTGPFVLSLAAGGADPCAASSDSTCAGKARLDNQRILLTNRDDVVGEGEAGVYWRHLGLGRNTRFRLIVDVAVQQPDDAPGGDGGIPGHGFAFAFVQDDDATPGFPSVREEHPSRLGINRLPGFFGAAAYVQTYDGGARGVFALRTTAIPSTPLDMVDGFGNGTNGNSETFGRTERAYLRFVIDGRPNQEPSVEMSRMTSANDANPRVIEVKRIPLPAMDRFDYFGVSASRGKATYSQSGHWLTSLALSCPVD